MVLDAGVDEFVLEGAVEPQPGGVLEGRKGAAQEVAGAAFPRYAGGGSNVAQEKMLGAEPSSKSTLSSLAGWGRGSGRRLAKGRVGDRSERRDHRVRGHPAHA